MRLAVPTAIAVMLVGSGWSAPAVASDWGCQVLLCLSNPGGPTQYAACVPPVTKLWQALATGHPFPTCIEGGVSGTKTHGKRGSSSYRVTMTYIDGSQQTYSLAGISSAASLDDVGNGSGNGELP
ncbi:hypothetical protein [Sphingomonas oryzagri]